MAGKTGQFFARHCDLLRCRAGPCRQGDGRPGACGGSMSHRRYSCCRVDDHGEMLGRHSMKWVFTQVRALSVVKHPIYEGADQIQRIVMVRTCRSGTGRTPAPPGACRSRPYGNAARPPSRTRWHPLGPRRHAGEVPDWFWEALETTWPRPSALESWLGSQRREVLEDFALAYLDAAETLDAAIATSGRAARGPACRAERGDHRLPVAAGRRDGRCGRPGAGTRARR